MIFVPAFNHDKDLVGAFSMIVKWNLCKPGFEALLGMPNISAKSSWSANYRHRTAGAVIDGADDDDDEDWGEKKVYTLIAGCWGEHQWVEHGADSWQQTAEATRNMGYWL